MPVGFNCSAVDLKPFKPAVTCIIPVDLNLVVAVFDQCRALAPRTEAPKKFHKKYNLALGLHVKPSRVQPRS